MEKIVVDGDIIYIEDLKNLNGNSYRNNTITDAFNIDMLKDALKPIINVGKIMKDEVIELGPNEMELEFQLKIGISDNKLAFAIVKAAAEAHVSLKFVWKSKTE